MTRVGEGRIRDRIITNHHGGTDTDEARVFEAERIIRAARATGCAVSRKIGPRHIPDDGPFEPRMDEYPIIAPMTGSSDPLCTRTPGG
jgi:hypothetical protein